MRKEHKAAGDTWSNTIVTSTMTKEGLKIKIEPALYKFSQSSLSKLKTCEQPLQDLFNEVIKGFDCTIICGTRDEADQNEAFEKGYSKLKYPMSKHNIFPSKAVDATPYPIDWKDAARQYFFAGYVKGIADKMGINIRLGADWDGDMQVKDQTFLDLCHFELKEN